MKCAWELTSYSRPTSLLVTLYDFVAFWFAQGIFIEIYFFDRVFIIISIKYLGTKQKQQLKSAGEKALVMDQ